MPRALPTLPGVALCKSRHPNGGAPDNFDVRSPWHTQKEIPTILYKLVFVYLYLYISPPGNTTVVTRCSPRMQRGKLWWWWWSRALTSCIRIEPVLRRSLRPKPRQMMCCHTWDSANAQGSCLNQSQYTDTGPTSRTEVQGYSPTPKSPVGDVSWVGLSMRGKLESAASVQHG